MAGKVSNVGRRFFCRRDEFSLGLRPLLELRDDNVPGRLIRQWHLLLPVSLLQSKQVDIVTILDCRQQIYTNFSLFFLFPINYRS